VLNGLGLRVVTNVTSVGKKQVVLKVQSLDQTKRKHFLSLAIGLPKKDAFEDILKISVELGIENIYPLTTKYSQYLYEPNERIQRIIESAMIQSNNSFFPVIHPQVSLESFLNAHNFPLYFLNSLEVETKVSANKNSQTCFLIGPEAGFTKDEVNLLRNHKYISEIHLPTPILRAPTAVATAAGFLLNQLS
jgi:16S rRNA (uracil1498-N3)-methyltransferase